MLLHYCAVRHRMFTRGRALAFVPLYRRATPVAGGPPSISGLAVGASAVGVVQPTCSHAIGRRCLLLPNRPNRVLWNLRVTAHCHPVPRRVPGSNPGGPASVSVSIAYAANRCGGGPKRTSCHGNFQTAQSVDQGAALPKQRLAPHPGLVQVFVQSLRALRCGRGGAQGTSGGYVRALNAFLHGAFDEGRIGELIRLDFLEEE